jgi:hypothetical protein
MWNVIINLVLFAWTAVMCTRFRGLIHRIHGKMFGLNENTINTMLYGFLALYKIIFIVFVFIPWIVLTIMS